MFFVKKMIFLEFVLYRGLTVDLGSNLKAERAIRELSIAHLRNTVAFLVPELCASLSKNVKIGQI